MAGLRYTALAFLVHVAIWLGPGCTQGRDTQTLANVEIRLDVPDDPAGATVALGGLPEATAATLRDAALDQDAWSSLLRITVHQPEVDPADTPPVLGDYDVDRDVIRFRPMFPFDPGREYVVTFDPAALPTTPTGAVLPAPVTAVIAVPQPEVEPTTVVARVFPSGARVPENQLKLYVEFSAPMSNVDGLQYVRLLDESGREVDAPFLPLGLEFWDYYHRRYTIFFDPGRVKQGILPNEQLGRPLTAGERYTLAVDASWPDANGVPMKEVFRKEFTVGPADTTPLDPSTWRLRVPTAGSTQRFVVSFPEPLDHGLLVRGLAVENGRGVRVNGNVEITNWETRWAFSPTAPWTAGKYSLVALSILEDLAGNRIGVPFEIDVFEQIDASPQQESYVIPFEIS